MQGGFKRPNYCISQFNHQRAVEYHNTAGQNNVTYESDYITKVIKIVLLKDDLF